MREVKAVKNVSFDVPHGTVLGVIGANGAGKSTLMRAIGGHPAADRRARRGPRPRVARCSRSASASTRSSPGATTCSSAASPPGSPREQLAEKYEEIVEFAELEEFMDMPMRTYSSGMYGRLAFSVAVNMDPDILLIDEALSVGDARFRRKSARKMRQLCAQDRTVVLVSHALGTVKRPVRPGDLAGQGRAADVGRAASRGRRLHGVPRGRARTRSRSRTSDLTTPAGRVL